MSDSTSGDFFDDKDIFPDFPVTGPLAKYRKSCTFDWKKLKLIIEDETTLRLRHKIWKFMETHPLFERTNKTLTLDENRHISQKRAFVVNNEHFYHIEEFINRPDLASKFATTLMAFDPNFAVKLSLGFGMFPNVIRSLDSSDGRLNWIVEDNLRMINFGAYALTEIGHGTNAKAMKTTATYDKESGDFILNTPDFEAAKAWAGNLGKTCTHAIVYAQLIVNGEKHGLNAFVVPLRDQKTLKTFPGVTIGDLGEKVGLNGIDNGFLIFNNYHISRENLLSRTGDVKEDGRYVSAYKDKSKRFGASLGALSGGRVNICDIASSYMTKAITIAVRYGASRRQFGPDDSDEEYPVIEYQSQQYRLLPHLASTYVIKVFSTWLAEIHGDLSVKMLMGESLAGVGIEIHAVSSATKPVCTWAARDCIQECREACGGHGYLKCAGLGELRNDNDANCTYEGENNVLIQQASNWLLNVRSKGYNDFIENSPIKSASFLANINEIMKMKFNWSTPEAALNPENLQITFDWIVAYLLEKTAKRVEVLKNQGKSAFDTRNDSQVFYARNLAIAYGHRTIFYASFETFKKLNGRPEKAVLMKLLSLYGANLIVTHYIGTLYEGGFIPSNISAPDIYQNGILNLLPELKNDAVGLVDAIAYPDFIINSPLGMSDGEIYKNLQSTLYTSPEVFERPSWWQDFVYKDSYLTPKYKL